MFSMFKQERDAQGREVLEMGLHERRVQALAVVVPLAAMVAAYLLFSRTPGGVPWYIFAVPIAFAAIGFAMVTWLSKRTRVRVTVDAAAGKLLVGSGAGESEVRMADVAKAEFGTTTVSSQSDSGTTTTQVSRLEFVMKNGERVPATEAYSSNHGASDQMRMTAAINAVLGKRP